MKLIWKIWNIAQNCGLGSWKKEKIIGLKVQKVIYAEDNGSGKCQINSRSASADAKPKKNAWYANQSIAI